MTQPGSSLETRSVVSLLGGRKPENYFVARKRRPLRAVSDAITELEARGNLIAQVDEAGARNNTFFIEINLKKIQQEDGYAHLTQGDVKALASYKSLSTYLKGKKYVLTCDSFGYQEKGQEWDLVRIYIYKKWESPKKK